MTVASTSGDRVTGERATTSSGGYNPTWQRHVAAYREVGALLPAGDPVLDLGCGLGHSFPLLGAHETIGLDLGFEALQGQSRPVVRADMRQIPLRADAVRAVVSVQSLEHVPNPERVLADVARVVSGDGTAIFVTPNRLTFGRPDEVIDPWHYIEFDAAELSALCRRSFAEVEVVGLFGSGRYLEFYASEQATLDRVLRRDALRLRRLVPRRVRQWAYDVMLHRHRRAEVHPLAESITADDFFVSADDVDRSLDLIAVCRHPLV
jgi:SAM-dependent methyltransferase